MKVAILDDYLGLSLSLTDWSSVTADCELTVFREAISPAEAAEALAPFEGLCLMRERTAFPAELIARLPNLKFLVTTGRPNRSIDLEACTARGIVVSYTDGTSDGMVATPEMAFALILAAARQLPQEARNLAEGGWQSRLGTTLYGKRLGLVGLGRIGQRMARYAQAFEMEVVAWSQNLTAEAASEAGAALVSKGELFATSDFVSIHYVLSDRSRKLVGEAEIAAMKPSAYLVNTSRGPIVDQAALTRALQDRTIAGAALDVFEVEPLPKDDPLRSLDNVILTPHSGYATDALFAEFYRQTCEALAAFIAGEPIRLLNPEVLAA